MINKNLCLDCGCEYPIEKMKSLIDGMYSVNLDTGEEEFPVGTCLECASEYDLPHVDEIQQAKMEDDAELQEFLKAEALLERGS